MQPSGYIPPFGPSKASATSLLGSTGRLTLAASVLGLARSIEVTGRISSSEWLLPSGRPAASFELAVQLYEDGRWADAYQAAASRADAGDPCAAKLALLMLRHGARLYGIGFAAEPRRVAQWAKTVLQATAVAEKAAALAKLQPGIPQRAPRSTSRRTASPTSITAIA